ASNGKPIKGALGPTTTSLVIIAGHDTNVSNLSGLLGVSWMIPSHQTDDVPPGSAMVFSLWKMSNGRYSVRLQFVSQTLDQMNKATQLTTQNPPVIVNLFIPGCSTSQEGYPCDWSSFKQVVNSSIDAS